MFNIKLTKNSIYFKETLQVWKNYKGNKEY